MARSAAVRICWSSCVNAHDRSAVTNALYAAGIEGAMPHDDDPRTPTVIVFDTALAETLELVRTHSVLVPERVLVIALSGDRLERSATAQLIAAGAADVLIVRVAEALAERVAARIERWATIDTLLASDLVAGALIGTSQAWRTVLRQVIEVARFTDAPVLITGETGTGKELVSRLVHALDRRSHKRDFVVLDCSTIVSGLSGSEFFGHEKGSFTGALAARNGAFALADHGTLFLDEVGELPVALQAELLRVVQERTYKRVGGSTWQTTEFRLVCATNRDLERDKDEGRFRSDLYYRISGWAFHLPPLRDRREDILPLVQHFLREQLGTAPELDAAVSLHLLRRTYRGNIRELRQICARLALRHVGPGPITVGDLGADFLSAAEASSEDWCDPALHRSIGRAVAMGVGLKEIGRTAEDIAVRIAIEGENGNLQHAARRLGVTDRALQLRRASSRSSEATGQPLGSPDKLA